MINLYFFEQVNSVDYRKFFGLKFVTYFFQLVMPGRLQTLLTVISFVISLQYADAQFLFDNAIKLTKENRLPSDDVRTIRLGNDGFVWIATAEGLCRFDGIAVKSYTHDPEDPQSLFPGQVNTALPWRGKIWVATNKGISVLDPQTEKFSHYQINHNTNGGLKSEYDGGAAVLFIDRQGELWAGCRSQGAWLFDTLKNEFRFFAWRKEAYAPITPSLSTNYSILSFEASAANPDIVWAGTPAGLEEVNKKTGEVKWYTFPQKDKNYQVSLNAFRRLYYHDDGLLYVGSWSAGINIFNPFTKTLTPLPVKEGPGVDILQSPISRILRKNKNEMWITSMTGLAVYDSDKKAVTFYKHNNGVKNEFYGVDCVDSMHRVWLSTINGVHYFDPVMQQFATYSYDELYGVNWGFAFYITPEDAANKIMVCPREANAFYLFDRATKRFEKQILPELKQWKLRQITLRGFTLLPGGDYFLSADEGLFVYNRSAKKLSRFAHPPQTQYNQWGDALVSKDGYLWLAANADGLIRRNLKTGEDKIFKKELLQPDATYSPRPSNLFEDSRHNIWFSCENGFGIYLASEERIVPFFYNQNPDNSFPFANSFAEDSKGRVWINSNDVWLGYADVNAPQKGIIKKISLEQKKISTKSFQLATDSSGNVWGYSNRYLFRIDNPDQPFRLFSFNYGVDNPDFFHFSFLPSGEMVFGGRNSITLAKPSELRRNKELPEPYILQLRLNQPDQAALYNPKQLDLNYKQNFFSLSFSAKAFTMSQDTRFRYRLKDFDNWIETTDDRLANYTNVPPGKYIFQLQAANNEGMWNEKMLELPVYIATPWWQTWWFRLSALAALLMLTWWLYRSRIDQIRKKEQLRSQYEKKLANVEMSALLAQMNPHFLFNSLNSIDSYIIRNESKKASEYLNNFARLVRLILQNSRSNYISLKDELESLDLYLQMETLRFANRFEYEIQLPPDIDSNAILIPPMLIQPYVENAIWHGLMHKKDGKQGKVELIISKRDDNLFCVIQDNGIGREKAETFRTQHPGNRKRSMGMQITKDRMEMINKLYSTNTTMQVIDLHDDEGNATGTRVELVIPI